MAPNHEDQSNAHQHSRQTQVLDALYCSEEHWEGEVGEVCFHGEDEVEDNFYGVNTDIEPNRFPLISLDQQETFRDDGQLVSLLSKELQNDQLFENLKNDPYLAGTRAEAVEWMLKVNAHYSFSVLTAILAVNYLDRFLSSFRSQAGKPWMIQLAAVACLSLAAKVEETQVLLLLELQGEDTRYVFEAKTIKRMEMLVLSTLQWKMNPVTPLSFLDYFIRRLGLKGHLCWEFLWSVEPCLLVEYQNQLLGILGIDKEKIDNCCELISELASGGYCNQSNKRKFGSIPGSPKGVMDVSFSSDSSNDSWAVAAPSVVSSPEPLSKKSRADPDQLPRTLNHQSADFFSIPHSS
ncbi:hypothetical protein I3842_16G036800 [Carya illinoinensis]|uniref:Cyclin-like domain-containing protein n=1 Tax=Carya illinoinensis TaxID=32201 RepID=A0A921ZZV5_CARIL|nr:hypothetical protein I3842_16G036800 [Carya illinoinensis]